MDFSAADSFDGVGVNERDMRKRHVIGWCSDAKVIAGKHSFPSAVIIQVCLCLSLSSTPV